MSHTLPAQDEVLKIAEEPLPLTPPFSSSTFQCSFILLLDNNVFGFLFISNL